MRLINQLHPVPLESLVSLLERLRQVNYYEETSWFRPLLPSPFVQDPNLLRATTHYRSLTELTGLDREQLWTLTLHRFAPHYYFPESLSHALGEYDDINMPLWETHGLGLYVHGRYYCKVCPLCWRDHHAQLLPWLLRHVTTCALHHVLLVDCCAACGASLRIHLATGSCTSCGAAVETFPPHSLGNHEESRVLTKLVWSALGCSNDAPAQMSFSAPLSQLSPVTVLQFLWRFGQLLIRRDPHNPLFDAAQAFIDMQQTPPAMFMRTASVKAVHRVMVAMVKLLLSGPSAFYTALERIVAQEEKEATLHARFPYILAEEFVGPPWAWLHQGWREFMSQQVGHSSSVYPWLRYYRTAQRSTTIDLPPLFSQKEATRLLHIGERSLRRSLENKELQATVRPQGGSRRAWQLIDAESLQRLQAKRETFLTLKEAAAYCGTSEVQIVALVATGMLQAEHGPLHDATPIWNFTEIALQQFLERCLGHLPAASPCSTDTTHVSLTQALRIVSAAGERLPSLLQALQQGTLLAWRSPEGARLKSIWFERSTIEAHLCWVQQAKERRVSTVEEVCVSLHCKPPVLQRWHRSGLLVPCTIENGPTGTRTWYAIQDVVTFCERYVTTDKAAELLRCTALTVQNWAKVGRIVAASGPNIDGCHVYRFEKEALVQWRYERVTVGEAADLLGVSVSTIDRWAREGRIEPLQDMGGKQRWFARQTLLTISNASNHPPSDSVIFE